MQTSDDITEFAMDFAKAQFEFKNALKDSANPFFKSKYADLSASIDAIKEAFGKHGFSFIQDVSSNKEDGNIITTRILHKSGQWIQSGPLEIPSKDVDDPQKVKSGITYMRRAQLQALAGIAEAADDGNAASTEKVNYNQQAQNRIDAAQKAFGGPPKQSMPNMAPKKP